jgi:nucleolar protein 56
MGKLYLLYESASGYGIFEQVKSEEIGSTLPEVQDSIVDLQRFNKIVKLKSFLPFRSAEDALENINAVSEGEMTENLFNFLELNLGKEKKASLGIIDTRIGNIISEKLGIKCKSGSLVSELMRGIRLHFDRFIKGLKPGDLAQAQLGLGHSYSRCKVKFNVHRVDNMIVQSICLLDQLDKDLNTFSMRVREWYSWHFPELQQIVKDNMMFAQCAQFLQHKDKMSEEKLPALEEITGDSEMAKQILDAARMSMGTDCSEIDMLNIVSFASRVVDLTKYRQKLHTYLTNKMNACAPNLSALIGEQVGARLISHAGSLTNLAKYPASTVQILGAEKALFRALKTKGNTPKYGLIFHSTFIGRAKPKNKGRISRYLANKCSLASRIDCFAEEVGNAYGEKLREQVEERLEFYKTGKAPRKNIDVMQEAVKASQAMQDDEEGEAPAAEPATKEAKKSKKKKKDKKRPAEEEAAPATKKQKVVAEEAAPKKAKKSKKKKKEKA